MQEAQRHVVENAGRIAKQKNLIAELQRDGHEKMVPEAERLLKTFEEVQQMALDYLERERKKAADEKT
jgi:hypothetical protein